MVGAIGHVLLVAVGVLWSLLVPGESMSPELTWKGWRRDCQPEQQAALVS